jgi:hypothetical protein
MTRRPAWTSRARYYASGQGRFASVDPLTASARAAGPQSWNRYAYVGNNPLSNTDPTGMDSEDAVNDPADDNSPAAEEQRQRQQQQQVVNVQDSKVINQRLEEINKAAQPLAPGEAPVPTKVEHIVGEVIQLKNATVIHVDGSSQQVADGYMRPVAVVVTDQKGNIIKDPNMTVTETVKPADANAQYLVDHHLLLTSNNQPVLQADNGVFYDAQGRAFEPPPISYNTTQDILIKEGRKGLFKIEGVKINTDDTKRSITITPGTIRQFH